jgi:hypothetical protein
MLKNVTKPHPGKGKMILCLIKHHTLKRNGGAVGKGQYNFYLSTGWK